MRRGYDYAVGLRTLRRVDRVLVASQQDVPWLTRRGISVDKIRVIPTPLSDDAYLPGDPATGRRLAGADRFLLYVGRLHREKGVAELLEAFARLPAGARLVFAGPDQGMLAPLRQRAADLHMSERVRFLGLVAEDEKRDLLAASAGLVLTSLYEAQGLTILEAWAQGRPVVATRVGALASLVVDGENGLLVSYGDIQELADALARLWNDEDATRRMGERGSLAAEAYRLSRLAPQLQAVYDEITRPSR
jgi:glycosyltransferase involved in cell wall biosynthesis